MTIDFSIKPEDDDEEAKRRMSDEMKGLMCGTNLDNLYNLDETASEEDSDVYISPSNPHAVRPQLKLSTPPRSPSLGRVTCKVCTTMHPALIPICCESCGNVLNPESIDKEKIWICLAPGCNGMAVGYVNFIDAGRCGLCGAKQAHDI